MQAGQNVQLLEDHPRVCGEKIRSIVDNTAMWGSPPRVRGKDTAAGSPSSAAGITPACAGKSWRARKGRPSARDHPRVCGEKLALPWRCSTGAGSPPRVRGKAHKVVIIVAENRITPACAGKSWRILHPRTDTRDHPRVCGEKG